MHDRCTTARRRSRSRCDDVKFTLVLTLFLVVVVIFLFLRNVSATLIPSLALPMSIIGTFSVMYLLGYSLDNLSLMALTLAVGFVVDDAIVMLENIVRHMEMGKPPMQAAIDGAAEVGFTILSMTLSLTAVFIPLLFMGGIIGRLFHEFAVTIGVGDSRVGLRVADAHADAVEPLPASRRSRRSTAGCINATERVYDACSQVVRAEPRLGDATSAADARSSRSSILVGTGVLFKIVPKGFIPTEDTGQISRRPKRRRARRSTTWSRTSSRSRRSSRRITNVAGFMSSVGSGGGQRRTRAACSSTSSRSANALSADEIVQRAAPEADAVSRA